MQNKKAHYHLPGLFEFFEFYQVFIPLFFERRDWFYDWCDIASIYGSPENCIWGGGRIGEGNYNPEEVADFMKNYGISGRLTFSNSLIRKEHLNDEKCNLLCKIFEKVNPGKNGVIVHSDLLLDYLCKSFPKLYFVSSTTKVITDFDELLNEVNRPLFSYVVPDFRLNKAFDKFSKMNSFQKEKLEFLCNECCWFGCNERKQCYENVSRINLGECVDEHKCCAPDSKNGYMFSKAMKNPAFISLNDILNVYLPNGFKNFKIEGRELGTALILEFLLYYMTIPEHQLEVRERIYLDNTLDLF